MKKLRNILFCEPGQGTKTERFLQWLINLAYIALFSVGVGIVSLYFGKVNYGPELFESYFQYTGIFLLNILPHLVRQQQITKIYLKDMQNLLFLIIHISIFIMTAMVKILIY